MPVYSTVCATDASVGMVWQVDGQSISLDGGSWTDSSFGDSEAFPKTDKLRGNFRKDGGGMRRWSYRKVLYIQMELCDNRTLRDHIDARNARGEAVFELEALTLLQQVTLAFIRTFRDAHYRECICGGKM